MRKSSLAVLAFMTRAVRRGIEARAGSVAVEFAIIAPLVLALILPVADLGALVYTQMQVQLAAQAGAEYAAAHAWDPTGIQAAVTSATPLTQTAGLTITPQPFTAQNVQFCGCVTGTSLTQTWQPCPNPRPICANGAPPPQSGVYYTIGATANYTTLTGMQYPWLSNHTVSAQTTVRVQ